MRIRLLRYTDIFQQWQLYAKVSALGPDPNVCVGMLTSMECASDKALGRDNAWSLPALEIRRFSILRTVRVQRNDTRKHRFKA